MAAAIEGFWSASSAPTPVKVAVRATLFVLTPLLHRLRRPHRRRGRIMNLRGPAWRSAIAPVSDVLDLAPPLSLRSRTGLAGSALHLLPACILGAPPRSRVRLGALVGIFDSRSPCLVEAPFTLLASSLVFEDDVRARDVLKASIGAAPRVLLARVAALVMIAVGFGCFFIPGIGFAALTLFRRRGDAARARGLMSAFGRAQRVAQNAFARSSSPSSSSAPSRSARRSWPDAGGRTLIGEVLQFRPPRAMWTDGGSALATIGLFLQRALSRDRALLLYLKRPHRHRRAGTPPFHINAPCTGRTSARRRLKRDCTMDPSHARELSPRGCHVAVDAPTPVDATAQDLPRSREKRIVPNQTSLSAANPPSPGSEAVR